jgi:P-type E1-E2 ATPase
LRVFFSVPTLTEPFIKATRPSRKKTIAVGDYNNDVPMLRAAAVGVAVANACAEAKETANYHTVSNEEHAIAKIIEDIENGKIFSC